MNDPHAHRPRRRASDACSSALPLSLLLLVAGCGNGSLGDLPPKPLADDLGPGPGLCNLIGPATAWLNPKDTMSLHCTNIPPTRAATTTGLTVVALDTFDETGDGKSLGNLYLEDVPCVDAGKPYSGVTVFSPAFTPPDLRLAPNDVVDFSGDIEEFIGPSVGFFGGCYTLPEITGTLTFRFDGASEPTPVPIKATDLTTYATGRPLLGMLVKMTGSPRVTINGTPAPSGGRYSAAVAVGAVSASGIPHITNELYDIAKDGPAIVDQKSFKSVTGIVTYFYGFHLAPRSPADFEP